jgi:formylglycine-generating enzyme required for sulfatase activity
MEMVYVPAGSFLMGSTDADPLAASEEKPQHSVTLDAFWIDKTEVTQRMYALCVDAHVCHEPTITSSRTRIQYWDDPQGSFEIFPVIYVNWNMAQTYCEWAGRRLPTEAEWEKAARGTDGRIYPWGNDPPNHELLNYDDWFGDTLNVGRYPDGASPYGAVDMAGSVYEWVADWYSATYYQSSPSTNPLGPESGEKRVVRGGGFERLRLESSDVMVRAATRFGVVPALPASPDDTLGRASANFSFGFRCARSP